MNYLVHHLIADLADKTKIDSAIASMQQAKGLHSHILKPYAEHKEAVEQILVRREQEGVLGAFIDEARANVERLFNEKAFPAVECQYLMDDFESKGLLPKH